MRGFVMTAVLVTMVGCAHGLPTIIPAATSASAGPTHYRLTTDYTMLDAQGRETGTHVITGDFTLTPQEIEWTRVTVGSATAHGQPPRAEEHRRFAEHRRYSRRDARTGFTTSAAR